MSISISISNSFQNPENPILIENSTENSNKTKPRGYWSIYKNRLNAASKCNSKSSYKKNFPTSYQKSRIKEGELDEFIILFNWEVKHRINGYWFDYDKRYETASKCNSQIEYKKKYSSSYNISRLSKDELIIFSKLFEWNIYQKPNGYWTIKENRLLAALTCDNKSKYREKYQISYNESCKNNELDELFPKNEFNLDELLILGKLFQNKTQFNKTYHEEYKWLKRSNKLKDFSIECGWKIAKQSRSWVLYEDRELAASTVKSRSEFFNKYTQAYNISNRNNEFKIFEEKFNWKKKNKKFNWFNNKNIGQHINFIKEKALLYDNRTEFKLNESKLYRECIKNNIIDEVCSHMGNKGNPRLRLIYVYEFEDNFAYVGLTFNLEYRKSKRLKSEKDSVTIHIKDTGLTPKIIELTGLIPEEDAQDMEIYYIEKYRKDGWNILNKNKGGGLGSKSLKWGYNECLLAASNYENKKQFFNGESGAFASAKRNNWMNDCIKRFKIKIIKLRYSKEECHSIALLYNTKTDFIKNNRSVYRFAENHGFKDEICSHMQTKKIKSKYDNYNLCLKYSKLVKNRKEFQVKYDRYYFYTNKNKWTDDFFPPKPNNFTFAKIEDSKIEITDDINETCKKYNFDKGAVRDCLNGKHKSHRGYTFKYLA